MYLIKVNPNLVEVFINKSQHISNITFERIRRSLNIKINTIQNTQLFYLPNFK
jgi:hypothetical protein